MKKLLPIMLSLALSSSAFAVFGSQRGNHTEDRKEARQAVRHARDQYRADKMDNETSQLKLENDKQAIQDARKNLKDIQDRSSKANRAVVHGSHRGGRGNQGGEGPSEQGEERGNQAAGRDDHGGSSLGRSDKDRSEVGNSGSGMQGGEGIGRSTQGGVGA